MLDVKQSIDDRYVTRHQRSAEQYAEATRLFPGGVTHDLRRLLPFPISIDHAEGSKKRDADGNEIVDYLVGHGSLIHGHGWAPMVEAVQRQVAKGTHFGSSHALEIEWARAVQRLMPAAERVKFVSSGTEATMLAMRLARAYTGRDKILKFAGHFHGWHDYATAGMAPPYDVPSSIGIPAGTLSSVVVTPANDVIALAAALKSQDVAAAIIEPTGGSWGTIPLRPAFLHELRQATRSTGTLLILDEVITGFRVAPGGAQERFSVPPDLITMAKILAGGLPGGAVAGRADILGMLDFKPDAKGNRFHRVPHPGTYNANPLSAGAGIAMLDSLLDGTTTRKIDRLNKRLRDGFNQAISEAGVEGCCYGDCSMFHLFLGRPCPGERAEGHAVYAHTAAELSAGMPAALTSKLRRAMINHGVDLMGSGGMLSDAHTTEDLDFTIDAFAASLADLKAEGDL